MKREDAQMLQHLPFMRLIGVHAFSPAARYLQRPGQYYSYKIRCRDPRDRSLPPGGVGRVSGD